MPDALSDWLLAVDLDGTLLRRDGTIATEDREALAEATLRGAAILLVTGRFPRAAQRIASRLALPVSRACLDGALVFDADQVCVGQQTVSRALIEQVRALSLHHGAHCFAVSEDHVSHREQDAGHLAYLHGWFEDHPVHVSTSCLGGPCLMLLVLAEHELVTRIQAEAVRDDQSVHDSFDSGTVRSGSHALAT